MRDRQRQRLQTNSRRLASIVVAAVGAAALAAGLGATACSTKPPGDDELERTVDYRIEPAGEASALREDLIDDLESADERIWAAVTTDVLDSEVASVLEEAAGEGLDVRVIGDADDRETDLFESIRNSDVETTFGDGELSYLPEPNLSQVLGRCRLDETKRVETCTSSSQTESPCNDETVGGGQGSVCRPGSFNRMSHRFFIIDKRVVWNFSNGFAEDSVGTIGWRARSEIIREDFEREFRQMFGGVFSTSLDVFNGPIKSSTDDNIEYTTDHGAMQIRFNPQERLMKHVIDEVYRARSSIQIMASEIRNPFLLDALEYKKDNGFAVQIVVGETGEQGGQPPGNAKRRLRNLEARSHPAGSGLPSVVVIDAITPEGEREWPRTALSLSHPLWHAQPFEVVGPPEDANNPDDRVRVYPSDHFVDGNYWKAYEFASNVDEDPRIDRMREFATSAWNSASPL